MVPALATYLLLRAHQCERRAIALQLDIRGRGGVCEFGATPVDRAREWLLNDGNATWTFVSLRGRAFGRVWLERNGYLQGLQIESLNLEGTSLSGNDVVELLDAHPVHYFEAEALSGTDEAAVALGHADRAICLKFRESDLTDAGLRNLPLERLEHLEIHGSAVSARGIEALRRCRCLNHLILDGKQIDDQSVRILSAIESLQRLELVGENVTDKTVAALHELQLPVSLGIDSRHTSMAAITKLHAVLRKRVLDSNPKDNSPLRPQCPSVDPDLL